MFIFIKKIEVSVTNVSVLNTKAFFGKITMIYCQKGFTPPRRTVVEIFPSEVTGSDVEGECLQVNRASLPRPTTQTVEKKLRLL